jgi:hypothetical protein
MVCWGIKAMRMASSGVLGHKHNYPHCVLGPCIISCTVFDMQLAPQSYSVSAGLPQPRRQPNILWARRAQVQWHQPIRKQGWVGDGFSTVPQCLETAAKYAWYSSWGMVSVTLWLVANQVLKALDHVPAREATAAVIKVPHQARPVSLVA